MRLWDAVEVGDELVAVRYVSIDETGAKRRYSADHIEDQCGGLPLESLRGLPGRLDEIVNDQFVAFWNNEESVCCTCMYGEVWALRLEGDELILMCDECDWAWRSPDVVGARPHPDGREREQGSAFDFGARRGTSRWATMPKFVTLVGHRSLSAPADGSVSSAVVGQSCVLATTLFGGIER